MLYEILNLLIGIVVGILIGKMTLNTTSYVGPNSRDIIKNTYRDSKGVCYKLIPKVYVCPLQNH